VKLVGMRRGTPAISLSALVDVLFILIVFVILAADFDRVRAVDVELPGAASGEAIDDRTVRLVVPARGSMRLGERTIADGEVEAALAAELARLRGDGEGAEWELVLVADGDVPLARATKVIDAARRAGFASASIATRTTSP
jgi:biopolymer transport protein ExbD